MIHLACAADDRYAPYCAAMLHSAFTRQPRGTVTAHFLHAPELSASARTRLRQLAADCGQALRLHEIGADTVAGLPEMERIPRLMWFRVLLPALLPELDRVLYVDADTLVVDDLAPLWQTDLAGAQLGAVANVIEPALRDRPRQLGLPAGTAYFNSGMLLMNLAAMRAAGSARAIVDYARREADRLLWPDQDALNVVLAPHCRFLHPRWNCQNTLFYWASAQEIFGAQAVREATRTPAILHFEGPDRAKPWHYLNNHPYRARYWRHLRATPFPAPAPTGATWRNRLARLAPRRLWRTLRLRLDHPLARP